MRRDERSNPPSRYSRSVVTEWMPLLFLAAVLGWMATDGVWARPGSEIIAGSGDAIQGVWQLGLVAHNVQHLTNPLFTTLANFPNGVNLAWNNPSLSLAVVFTPLTLLVGAIASFNILLLLSLIANAIAMFALLNYLQSNRWLALVGALLFEINPFVLEQLDGGHLFFVALFLLPLIILVTLKGLAANSKQRRYYGLLLALCLVAQFYLAQELLLLGVCVGIIYLILVAIFDIASLRGIKHASLQLALWAIPLAAIFILPGVWFLLLGPGAVHGDPLLPLGATPLTWITPSPANYLFQPWMIGAVRRAYATNPTEIPATYIGIIAIGAVLLGLATRWRDKTLRVIGLTTLVGLVLTLGESLKLRAVTVPLPGAVFHYLPLLRDLVLPRFIVFADLAFIVFVVLLLAQLKMRPLFLLGSIALLLVSWMPQLAGASPVSISGMPNNLPVASSQSILFLPYIYWTDADAGLLQQAESQFRYALSDGYYTSGQYKFPTDYGNTPSLFTRSLIAEEYDQSTPVWQNSVTASAWQYIMAHRVEVILLSNTSGFQEPIHDQRVMTWLTKLLHVSWHRDGGYWELKISSRLGAPGG